MAIFSPLATRRKNRRLRTEATQQVIVFRLRNEGFALPIRAVQKVIPMDKVYGAPGGGGVSLTLYQDRELMVIDVGRRIFRGKPSDESFKSNLLPPSPLLGEGEPLPSLHRPDIGQPTPTDTQSESGYLLLVQSSRGQMVGLPIAEPPSLLRVPASAFAPLSASYLAEGNLRCVSALIKQMNDRPALFLLNPDQLVQSDPALPPA
jgi:purine-binding chemotaxis protein CheW